MTKGSKAVCQCVCCEGWFPFTLSSYDGDLNGPVCLECWHHLQRAKLELWTVGLKVCCKPGAKK